MISVHLVPVAVLVAGDAVEYLIVVRICMAIGAGRPLTAMLARIDREPLLIVLLVEVRVPVGGSMANRAVVRELGVTVVRIRNVIEGVGMTGVTIGWSASKPAVGMARGTLNLPMRSG